MVVSCRHDLRMERLLALGVISNGASGALLMLMCVVFRTCLNLQCYTVHHASHIPTHSNENRNLRTLHPRGGMRAPAQNGPTFTNHSSLPPPPPVRHPRARGPG